MLRLYIFSVFVISSSWAGVLLGPFSSVAPPLPSAIPSIGPTPFGPRFVPGYSNRYYNRSPGPNVPILSYSSQNNGDGNYAFSFTTGDGKQAQETGFLKDAYIDKAGNPQGTQVVQGSYSYVSPDGTPVQVAYTADENGFRTSNVQIPSDGKAIPPPVSPSRERIISPLLKDSININNGYNYPYSRGPYGNNGLRPYDSRHPYDSRYHYNSRYPYDARHPYGQVKYDRYYNPSNNRYNPINKSWISVISEEMQKVVV